MANMLSAETFISGVRNSGLIPADQLDRLLDEIDAETPEAVAGELVTRNVLTRWQADKILQGRGGFFLGKYRLLSLLGKGGMSAVYLAEHILMRRRCAIKVLPQKRVSDSSYLGRFYREAQAIAALDHPNIVRAYDVDHETKDNIHFLVMEYVEGRSLHEVIQQDGVLPFDLAADYCRQAAIGLEYAHQEGFVHRDIKPGNLLLDRNDTIKILDLGLARFSGDGDETSLTVAHDEKVLGTADYLAPEQALDSHTVDARADIYSLGCTLYFLLTGSPPFSEGRLAQRLLAHQSKAPPPLAERRPGVPTSLAAIVMKMMAKRADDRYQNAAEVSAALANWLTTKGEAGSESGRMAVVTNPSAGKARSGAINGQRPDSKAELPPPKPPSSKSRRPPGSSNRVSPARPAGATGPATIKTGSDPPLAKPVSSRPRQNAAPAPLPFPVPLGPVDSEFQSFELLETAPPMPGGPRSGVRRSSSPVSPVVWIAAAIGLVLVLVFVVFMMIRRPPATVDSGSPGPVETVSTEDASSSKSSIGAELIGKEITVAADGNFKTIGEALAYVRKHRDAVGDKGQVIKVAGGQTYREALVIDNSDWTFPAGVKLVSDGAEPAVLSSEGDGPVLKLLGTERLEIEGFRIDAVGKSVAVEFGGTLTAVALRNLTIDGVSGTALAGLGPTGLFVERDRMQIDRVTIHGADDEAVGIRLKPGDTRTAHLLLTKLRFIGPMDIGVAIEDSATTIEVRESIFSGVTTGIRFVGSPLLRDVLLRNNTFYQNDRGIVFDAMPDGSSNELAIRRNVFSESKTADAAVAAGYAADAFLAMLTTGGIEHNLTTRNDPAEGSLDLFSSLGQRGTDLAFASTQTDQPAFLTPTGAAAKLGGGQGADAYAGAVAPQ